MRKHPDLGKKLHCLYTLRINPEIQCHADLAKELKVSRQAVSRWCRGTAFQVGDAIPDYQVIPLADVFGIEIHWLTFDLEDFETAVKTKLVAEKTGPVDRSIQVSTATLPITSLKTIGREEEIRKLNSCWQNNRANVVQILAFGGVGKSSLVNKWLSDLSTEHYRFARRVYAWSFYWQGHSSEMNSSGDFFIEHALQWFGDESPTQGTPWAKATRLAHHIRSYRTLLILDGLEPLQYPPGPKAGQIESPAVSLLIRELAAENNGLCVLTSRLPVADLERFSDGRVEQIDLENLNLTAGQAVLRNLGVSGDSRKCEQAVTLYSGHALSLTLLAGYLSVVHNGDIRKFRELGSLLHERKQSEHVKSLMLAYLDWFKLKPEIELLYLISMFDRAVSQEDLLKFISIEKVPNLTENLKAFDQDRWRYTVDLLEEAQLIVTQRKGKQLMLDCHPIVRDVVSFYLETENYETWVTAHSMIFDFLVSNAVAEPSNMNELEPLFRAVIHAIQAARINEAFVVYFEKIKKGQFSITTEMSHHADHACLRAFFEKEWHQPISDLNEEAQVFLLTSASTNLIYLGDIKAALDPSNRSIDWFKRNHRWEEAAAAAAPQVSMLIAAGRLNEALQLLEELRTIVEKSGSELLKGALNSFRGYAYHLAGNDSEASQCFVDSEHSYANAKENEQENYGIISAYYCKYLLDQGENYKALDRSLKTFAWRERRSWHVEVDTTSIYASDLIVLGLVFLNLGDTQNAWKCLNKQVELLKSADEWLYLPTGLNARAKYYIRTEEFELAQIDLEESLEISTYSGAVFGEWESYLELANLKLAEGKPEEAAGFLSKAENLEGMDIYRFRDSEISEMERHIRQI